MYGCECFPLDSWLMSIICLFAVLFSSFTISFFMSHLSLSFVYLFLRQFQYLLAIILSSSLLLLLMLCDSCGWHFSVGIINSFCWNSVLFLFLFPFYLCCCLCSCTYWIQLNNCKGRKNHFCPWAKFKNWNPTRWSRATNLVLEFYWLNQVSYGFISIFYDTVLSCIAKFNLDKRSFTN